MSENWEILNSTAINLKSVVQSCKGGVALRDLENDYKLLIGSPIPLESMGFKSLDVFLQSIPEVVKIKKNNGELTVEAAADSSTAHLVKLISKQRDKPSKKVSKTKSYQNTKYKPHQNGYVAQQQKYALYRSKQSINNAITQINQRTSPHFPSGIFSQKNAPNTSKSCQESTPLRSNNCERNGKTYYINRRTSPRFQESTKYSQNFIPHKNKFFQKLATSHDKCERNGKTNDAQNEKEVLFTNYGSLVVRMKNELADMENKQKETVKHENSNQTQKIGNNCEEKSPMMESHIIFIQNLVRPFTTPQLKALLKKTGNLVEEKFWIDKIKSKCFVAYESEAEAIETKNRLNGLRWPSFSPKTLIVDFSTEEKLNLHKSDIPQPKSDSDNMPPMVKNEHIFLHRKSHEDAEGGKLKSNSENIPPKSTYQKKTSPKVIATKKRKSLQRFGPYAKSQHSNEDISSKSTSFETKKEA